ncbi:glycosyltransferase [Paraburkholderia sp. UCT31]|uniref:glycosyltransferase n=1 Tax=Paraburkholderia sp. UCT31 TaxID=2615209 RepID=UPI00165533C5|nr:glycosyltransferase [Paraburkholderia sp. UCT31]MBC8737350.1 glycosyltransferase [Paraburkholderia sp. UCT31]
MKIGLVAHGLSAGGAERLLCNLADAFAASGHDIVVITFDEGATDFYPLPGACRRVRVGSTVASPTVFHSLVRNARRVFQLSRALTAEAPDVVVSFLSRTNAVTVAACRLSRTPCVITEHVRAAPDNRFWTTAIARTYPHADALVSVSAGVDADFAWIDSSQRFVIPNLIKTPENVVATPRGETRGLRFVSMGRLTEQKNQALLLDAFAKYRSVDADATLTLIGDGPLRAPLQEYARAHALDEYVTFTGELQDPFPVLKASDAFVLSSDFEGFGNVLVEAMSIGLPVISTDCPHGPGEILGGGAGILVPVCDATSLARAMQKLGQSPYERARLAAAGLERSQAFSRSAILPQWLRLLERVGRNTTTATGNAQAAAPRARDVTSAS